MTSETLSEDELRSLYGNPTDFIANAYANKLPDTAKYFIQACPFLVLSSQNKDGYIDMSPRGGEPGFIKVIDNQTIAFLDQRGNNKLHTLSNLTQHPQVGLLFMIPAVGEVLRAYGIARASDDEKTIEALGGNPKRNKTVISIEIKKIFPHCPAAINKSGIWKDQGEHKPEMPGIMELAKSMSDGH